MRESITDPSLTDLISRITFDKESGQIWLDEHRMLLLHTASFGALRKELIESLGYEHAKGVLARMGWESGKNDALLVRRVRPGASIEEAFMVGPQLHTLEGVARVERVVLEMDRERGEYYGEFLWFNSFEAEEHIRTLGQSEHPVCWNQIGYATGYTSDFMGCDVLYNEIECIGKGDPHCRIIGKPAAQWKDSAGMCSLYKRTSIAETLYNLQSEVASLRSTLHETVELQDIVAESDATKSCLEQVIRASQVDVTVLFSGTTGVGKEVFSSILHKISPRAEGPFVAVNCAALPSDLVEAELFGVEKGAYTGAEKSRPGRFERASGGTLFLDEIGELSLGAQAKLLRVLQSGELDRVGGSETRKVDIRLIAATNRCLEDMVKEGEFRADLLYRINVFPVEIPGLKDRLEDIPALTKKFVDRYNAKYAKRAVGVTDRVKHAFLHYHWPGNVRELENVIERAVILTDDGDLIDLEKLPSEIRQREGASLQVTNQGTLATGTDQNDVVAAVLDSGLSFEMIEREVLQAALFNSEGNVAQAARMLSMGDAQLRYRLKKHKLKVL